MCVGLAGHVAVEDYAGAVRCREAGSELATRIFGGSSISVSAACIDTPLVGATDRVAGRSATAPIHAAPSADVPGAQRFWVSEISRIGPVLSRAHIQRSVVLLI